MPVTEPVITEAFVGGIQTKISSDTPQTTWVHFSGSARDSYIADLDWIPLTSAATATATAGATAGEDSEREKDQILVLQRLNRLQVNLRPDSLLTPY